MPDPCSRSNTPRRPHGDNDDHHHARGLPPHRPTGRIGAAIVWGCKYLGLLVFRNRYAIVLASLVWLIWRSGTQPRRLAYPCQQAAAANLTLLGIPLIPGVGRLRERHTGRRRRAFALATGCLGLAGTIFVVISGGIAYYNQRDLGEPPAIRSTTSGTGVPATVSIVKDDDGVYTDAELDQMVRRAVALAGGLESVMADTRGGGEVPWNSPDGKINVIIIPNMSGLQPGLNTDPRITRTVVDMAWEAGADAVKLGGAATGDNWTAFHDQGYDVNYDHFMDHDPRVPLIDLNDTGTTGACEGLVQYNNVTQINLPTSGVGAAVARSSYWVNNELLQTDVMIVVPIHKNHDLGTVTLSLKMRIGTAPQDIYFAPWLTCSDEPFLRWEMHNVSSTRFPWDIGSPPTSEPECVQRSLVDLNLVRPADFVVLDALVGCESGPLTYDEPSSRVKSVMAGSDPLAIDTIGALVMGYDPDRIPCLNMANDTQALGVKDRRLITVAGDRVQNTRVDFSVTHSTGYATAYRAESVPPTLAGVSLVEGQAVAGEANSIVTCTGVADDVGVIKAELALTPAAPPNLLIDGGFEAGGAGWSTYHSSWGGNDGQVDFNSAEAGRIGNNALHLYLNPGTDDSFAVYQEVPVMPGKAYRIDASWKADYYGPDSWYEIMLIDGPWDPYQADTGGAAVLANHMFAYDTNASANCPGGNPLTAGFDWTWTHDQYDQNVDNCWNDRDGVRVASGNVMTVVLKAGSCCGTNQADVWFDGVSLTEVVNPEEFVVATVLDPPNTFDIVWDSTAVPLGWYLARVSVYDAMMNESTITRNIQVVEADTPLIDLAPTALTQSVMMGRDCPEDAFAVANVGVGTLDYAISTDQPWLGVVPETGSSTGEADTIAVLYNCAVLPVGTHHANIIVSDNGSLPAPAANAPRTVAVTVVVRTVRPDYDQDGDVDQEDYGHAQACLSGEGTPTADPGCANADMDGDLDVDRFDLDSFAYCFGGPGVMADEACDPGI